MWGQTVCHISMWQLQDFLRVLNVLLCEKSVSKENPLLPMEKVPSFVLPKNAIMLQNFIIQFALYYLSNVSLPEIKKESLKLLILKAVAVTYVRLLLRRDSTPKLLVI